MQKNTNLPSLHSTVSDFIWVVEKEKERRKYLWDYPVASSNMNLKIQNSMSELAKAKWFIMSKQQQNFGSQEGFIMSWVAFWFDG